MTEQETYLSNHFLIAMPTMDDPNFFQAVAYICEHTEDGAIGIVINKPTSVNIAEILTQMDIPIKNPDVHHLPVLYGGPVHPERGFVIHKPQGLWISSFNATTEIAITTSRDILQAIALNEGPKDMLISLGYAGWGAGQLEEELAKNSWLNCDASPEILFNTPYELRWKAALATLGIDANALSSEIGHA